MAGVVSGRFVLAEKSVLSGGTGRSDIRELLRCVSISIVVVWRMGRGSSRR